MSAPRTLATAAAIVLAFPSAAFALPLLQAVEQAIDRSPAVIAAAKQTGVYRARQELASRAGKARLDFDGAAGVQNSNLFGRGNQTQLRRDLGLRMTQRFLDANRTSNAVDAATLRADAVQFDVALAADRVAFSVAQAYLTGLRTYTLLNKLDENLDQHRWLTGIAKERIAKNLLAAPRLTELEARIAPLELERADLVQELARSRANLVELVGDPGLLEKPPALPERLKPSPRDGAPPTDHPAIRRAALLADAARKNLEAVRAGVWPTLDGELGSRALGDADGLYGLQWDNQALLRLRWNAFGENVPAQVREAQDGLDAALAEAQQAERDVFLQSSESTALLRALRDKRRIYAEHERVSAFSLEAGMKYFTQTTRFATDMLALADLMNVRFHAAANVASADVDIQLAEFRLLQSRGQLYPTMLEAFKQ